MYNFATGVNFLRKKNLRELFLRIAGKNRKNRKKLEPQKFRATR